MAVCIAIIGKDVSQANCSDFLLLSPFPPKNSPQFIATSDTGKELELQYRVHAALDIVEEKCAIGITQAQDSRDLYIGLLYSTEYYKM